MNRDLVKGAIALSTPTQPTWNESLVAGMEKGQEALEISRNNDKIERKAINQKVAGYIDALDTNVDITELTGTQQKAVTNYLVKQRNEYANAASMIAKIEDPSSPMYSELRDKINGIQMSFKNLAGQVNSYKKDKASYLKDFDNNLISDGNELSTLSESANLYTDGADLGVGEGGGLVFWNQNKETYSSYNQMPKPFLKDFGAADQLLQMNSSVYSSGRALTGARKNMMRQKLNNIISKGGRSSLLSMASDDFIMEGGLGIQDPELLKPGNEDALKQTVMDSYMEVLSNSADQGANDKRPASGSKTAGFSGALKDEITTSEGAVNNALNFSTLTKNVPGNLRENKTKVLLNELNKIDTSSNINYLTRGEMYNKYLEVNEIQDESKEDRDNFKKEFGNSQIYTYNPKTRSLSDSQAVNINTDNPKDLYKFYLDNLDLSTKARNHFYSNYENYTKGSTPSNSSTNSSKSGGSLDNI
mgnify:FL=1